MKKENLKVGMIITLREADYSIKAIITKISKMSIYLTTIHTNPKDVNYMGLAWDMELNRISDDLKYIPNDDYDIMKN